MRYLKTYEEKLMDHELPDAPDDAKFKIGDHVRVVDGWSSEDYDEDGNLAWDDTVYKLQRYYKKDHWGNDYEVEILDLRDKGWYVVHESQLKFVPEYEVTGNKFNL